MTRPTAFAALAATGLTITAHTDSVILAGNRHALTLDVLEEIAAASVAAGIGVGVIPDGAPATPISVNSTESVLISAGEAAVDDSGKRMTEATHEILSRPWSVIGIIGHGDGMHLNLGGSALCGLIDDVERTAEGPVHGGCSTRNCKKGGELDAVVRAATLRCDLLVLLSCTSMLLGSQLYPSDLSLALAAFGGGTVRHVIGTTRQTPQRASEFHELTEHLAAGHTLGQAVLAMNENRDIDRDGALVLLGDPRNGMKATPTGDVPRTPATSQPSAALPIGADLLNRLGDSERLDRAFALLVRQNLGAEHPMLVQLRELAKVRTVWRETAWAALAHERMTGRLPESVRIKSDRLDADWTERIATLMSGGLLSESHPGAAVGDMVQPALSLWLRAGSRNPTGLRCPHCRGKLFQVAYTMAEQVTAQASRIHWDCAACGLGASRIADVAGDDVPLRWIFGRGPGDRLRFELRLGSNSKPIRRLVLLQVRDKTKRAALPITRHEIGSATAAELTVEMPEDTGSDIGSARAVVIGAGGIDFYRCLFALHR